MSADATGDRRAKRVLLLGLALSTAAMIAAWVLSIHTSTAHPSVPVYSYILEGSYSAVPLTAIALLLTLRRPGHRVTWVFVAIAAAGSAQALTGSYAHEALLGRGGELPGGEAALLASSAAQSSFVILSILMINVFPTGRAATRRWQPVIWVTIAAVVLSGLQPFLAEHPWAGDPDFPWFESVTGSLHGLVPAVVATVLGAAASATTLLMLLGTPVHLVVRFRRSGGIERAQIKWLVYAFLATLTALLLPWSSPVLSWTGVHRLPAWVLWTVGPLAIWGAVAIAVLRYRLYDIDRVVSRTVSYALLTGVLVGVYAIGVLGIGALIPGEPNDLLVAGSTLAVAALFGPLRSWIQGLVDRRFNRSHQDAARIAEAFSARLRDEIDLSALRADLLQTARASVEPTAATLWLAP